MDAISISDQNKASKKINALLIDQKSWGALNLILINWKYWDINAIWTSKAKPKLKHVLKLFC